MSTLSTELGNCPMDPLNNFIFKNLLAWCDSANIVKNSDKSKYVYNGYGIAFDGAGSWNFGKPLLGML